MTIRFTLGNQEGNMVALQRCVCVPPTPFNSENRWEKFGELDSVLTLMIVSWRTAPSRVTQKSGIWVGALSSCHFLPSAVSGCFALRAALNELWFWWAGWRSFKVRRALRDGGKNGLSVSCFSCCATWKSYSFVIFLDFLICKIGIFLPDSFLRGLRLPIWPFS